MAYAKNQFDSGIIKIKDGTGTPLVCTVRLDQGSYAVEGLKEGLRNVNAYQSRGKVVALRKTDRAFPTVRFSAIVAEFSNGTTGTPLDMVFGTGQFAARVSTTAAKGDAMTFDVEFTMEGTTYGDGDDHVITLEDVLFDASFSEGDPNMLTFSGTVYGNIPELEAEPED